MVYVVYHGTKRENVGSIEREGLRPSKSYSGYYDEPTVSTSRDVAGVYAIDFGLANESGVVFEFHIPDDLVNEYLYPAKAYVAGQAMHGLRKPLPPSFIARKFRVSPGGVYRSFPEYSPYRRPVSVQAYRRSR